MSATMVGGSFTATGLMNALNGQQETMSQHQQQQQSASPLASSQQFCLKWNNHTNNLIRTFSEMISGESFTDVTLACDGLSIKAHKMVLSACSNYFRDLFLSTPCKHPIVILKDMKYEDLRAIIDFMYRGEVNVSQNNLGALLKTAEVLRVKGLTEVTDQQEEISTGKGSCGEFVSEGQMEQSNGHHQQHLTQEMISQEHHALEALHSIATASHSIPHSIPTASHSISHSIPTASHSISHSIPTASVASQNQSAVHAPISGSKKRKRVQTKKRLQREQTSNSGTVSNPSMVPPLPIMGHVGMETNQVAKEEDGDGDDAANVGETREISQAVDGEEDGSQSDHGHGTSVHGHGTSVHGHGASVHGYSEEEEQGEGRSNSNVANHGNVSSGMYGSPSSSHAQTMNSTNHNMMNSISSMGDQTPVSSNNGTYTMAQSPTGSRMLPRRMMMNQPISSPSTSSGVRDVAAGDCNSSHGQDVSNDGSSEDCMYNQQGQTMAVALRPPDNDDDESDLGDSSAGSRSMVMYGNSSQGSSAMAAEQAMQAEINHAMSQALALQVESLQALQGTPQAPGPDGTPNSGKICVCHLCHLTFTAYSSLRRHMARHFTERERYECDVCFKTYSRKDYLKEHRKLKHQL